MNKPRTNRHRRPGARVLCAILLAALSHQAAAQSAADVKPEPKVFPPTEFPAEWTAKTHGTPVRAALPAPVSPSAPHPRWSVDHTRLYFDTPGDGLLWVRGRQWKASFGPDGIVFIPFMGSRAAADHPVAMRIAGASVGGSPILMDAGSPAVRDGHRIRYERGGMIERYDLDLDSIEQSFVFASLPRSSAGDLVLRLAVETAMSRAATSDGIDLESADGRVHIGRATVRDAAGREQVIESALGANEITYTVPAAFLAGATLPVTIDPVVATFAIDNSSQSDVNPDVAYDVTTDHYLTVFEEIYSSSDHDIFAWMTDGFGGYVDTGYVDSSSVYWLDAHVANNAEASQFMVVAQVNASSPTTIKARQTPANLVNLGLISTISGTEFGDQVHPDIGGDPTFSSPTYYLVTWQRNYAADDTDILAALIDPTGVNVDGTLLIENSSHTLDDSPRISKSDGMAPYETQAWTIVWRHAKNGFDHDIYAAQVRWNGLTWHSTFPIDTSIGDDHSPVVSSIQDDMEGTRRFMVASVRYVSTDNDIMGWVYDGTNVVTGGNLSSLEPYPLVYQNQDLPSAECDGRRFVVNYTEDAMFPVGDSNTWLTSFEVAGPSLVVSENHKATGYTSNLEFHTGITSKHSGGGAPGRFMIAFDSIAPGYSGDVDGAFYDVPVSTDFCVPGHDAIGCPCGNSPLNGGVGCNNSINAGGAWLRATGTTSPDTMVLQVDAMTLSATSVFLQGTAALGYGVTFGDGVRCIGGTLVRLAVKHNVNGGATYPQAGDLSISARSAQLGHPIPLGAQRFYQTYYRDPANYACTDTFNISNGVVIDW